MTAYLVALGLAACVPGRGDPGLARFGEGAQVLGRVVENNTACVVDGVCFLRIEFEDTTVTAIYGTGERPAPPCELPVEVSDAAFRVEAGDVIEVVVETCPSEGLFLRSVSQPGG